MTDAGGLLGDELADRPRHTPDAKPLTTAAAPARGPRRRRGRADRASCTGTGLLGTTVLDLSGMVPRDAGRWLLCLDVTADAVAADRGDTVTPLGRPDRLTRRCRPTAWPASSRRSGCRTRPPSEEPLSRVMELPDLLGLGDAAAVDPRVTWRPRPNRDRLRVPLGVGPDGDVVELDLKESAQDGMGPHGLLIGATGSGKSELLRTLVPALAVTHSSEELNFVLVDFKGGATFASLDALPHTSAVITNLADELPLVDRMQDALAGELVRRQELLRAAGNYVSLLDYEKARAAGEPLAPLPSLLVICDEFSELLAAKPDFIDLFVHDRPARPVARRAPAAGLPAAGGGPAARAGHPPVVPDRPAHVLGDGEPDRARRARRVRAAQRARARLPEVRHRDAAAVPGRVRVRAVPARPALPAGLAGGCAGARSCRYGGAASCPRRSQPVPTEPRGCRGERSRGGQADRCST